MYGDHGCGGDGYGHGYGYGGGCSRGSRIRRGFLIGLFSIGTIGGFASGIHCMKERCHARRESFEQHVADVCVRAAKQAEAADATAAAAKPAAQDATK